MLQKFMEAVQAWITEQCRPRDEQAYLNLLVRRHLRRGPLHRSLLYGFGNPEPLEHHPSFCPTLPDLSPLTTFSFGLVGLFMAFIIPHNVAVKEDRKDRSMIAGFTGIERLHAVYEPYDH